MLISNQQALQQKGSYRQFNGAVFSDVSFGFIPAFKNLQDEQVHLSMDRNGELSLMHIFDSLPHEWVKEWDEKGSAVSLQPTVIAGFMRNSEFFTLSELMGCLRDS